MLLSTTDNLPGKRITAVKGLAQGSTVRSRHVGRDIVASLRTLVGGEVTEYTRLLAESRRLATERMTGRAEALGANAVVGVRYVTSEVMSGASELLAYGTAVVVEDDTEQT